MRKTALIVFILIAALCLASMSGCTSDVVDAWNDLKRGERTYLVVGLDDASNNTDVILLVSIRENDGTASILQVPRDTYYADGEYTGKINGIYPTMLNRGMKEGTALDKLSSVLGAVLGINIDGSVGLRTDFVKSVADRVGGIDIDASSPIEIPRPDGSTLVLREGNNHLDGADVLLLIRHRASYGTGDLGRMDMQKLVLSSLIAKARERLRLGDVLSLLLDNGKNLVSNLDFADIYNILLKNLGRKDKMNICYATLPGTSDRLEDGLWYYFISKNAAEELLRELKLGGELDPNGRLIAAGKEKLYYEKEIKPRIFYNEDLSDIRIN